MERKLLVEDAFGLLRVALLEDGRLVGIVSLADLAKSRRLDMEAAQALCEISENIIIR